MKKGKILLFLLALAFATGAKAQQQPQPILEFVMELRVKIDKPFSVGRTPHGQRTVIPILGGTFEGPLLKGEILSGGADYQMSDELTHRTEIEAIYCIRTDDGVTIHVRNNGIIKMGGQGGMYFRCAPKFEAPKDSKYAWMNESLFLCQPGFGGAGGGITLDVWKVK